MSRYHSRSANILVVMIAVGLSTAVIARQSPRSTAVVTPDDPIWAQNPDPQNPAPGGGDQDGQGTQQPGGGRGGGQPPAPRPYAQVITSAAKIGSRHLHHSPRERAAVLRDPEGGARQGLPAGQPVEADDARRRLRRRSGRQSAASLGAERQPRAAQDGQLQHDLERRRPTQITRAVDDSNMPAIVRAFNVAAFSPTAIRSSTSRRCITTEIAELSAPAAASAAAASTPTRSFIEKAVSFPQNINVEVVQTYTGAARRRRGAGRGRGARAACAATAAPCSRSTA